MANHIYYGPEIWNGPKNLLFLIYCNANNNSIVDSVFISTDLFFILIFLGSECVLTPEESMRIQNSIGADIMMQLDDVVDVRETDYARFKEATHRWRTWLGWNNNYFYVG